MVEYATWVAVGIVLAVVLVPKAAPRRAAKIALRLRGWRYAHRTRPPRNHARLPRAMRLTLFFPFYGMAAAAVVALVLTGQTWTWRMPVWVAITYLWGRKALERRKGLRFRTARAFKRRAGDAWRGYGA